MSEARRRLAARFGPLVASGLYRSEPVSTIPQPDFWNAVVRGSTTELPEALLAFAQSVERDLGRAARPRNAPREIDIDLLFVGGLRRRTDALELPHPRLRERRFVLAPLAELGPELELPPDGTTVGALLARLGPTPRVERVDDWLTAPG